MVFGKKIFLLLEMLKGKCIQNLPKTFWPFEWPIKSGFHFLQLGKKKKKKMIICLKKLTAKPYLWDWFYWVLYSFCHCHFCGRKFDLKLRGCVQEILEEWKVLFKQKEGREEGTFQISFFQSRIFHDTTKHPLKFFVISFQNVSPSLSCNLMSFGCKSESAGSLDIGWEGLKYMRVGLYHLFGRLVAKRWKRKSALILRKSFPSAPCFTKEGKCLEPKFLKRGMEVTYWKSERLQYLESVEDSKRRLGLKTERPWIDQTHMFWWLKSYFRVLFLISVRFLLLIVIKFLPSVLIPSTNY